MVQDPHAPAPDQEMSNFFNDLRNTWDRYGSVMLWVIVIGSFGYLAYSLVNYNRVTTLENAWSDLANSTAPASFEQVADDHDLPAVRQLALLTAADMYLGEAAELSDGEALTAKLDQAEALYERVAAEATHDIYWLNATEGLAVVAEGRRDMALAKERNEAIVARAEAVPGFETWVARATARMALSPRLVEPVSFKEGAPEAEAEAEASEADGVVAPLLDTESLELDPIVLPE